MNASVNKQKSRIDRGRSGFTLVEMLVVIAIIGILAAVLVPVIGSSIRRANEFAIGNDMQVQIKQAIENFKNKHSVYPTDFGNPNTLRPIVNKISTRHAYERAGAGALVSGNPLDTATWYGTDDLANPHYFRNRSTVEFRSPNTIDAAESWVFWLYETTINQEWPLGAIWDPNVGKYRLGLNADNAINFQSWEAVWRGGKQYMEFDEKRLTDIDNDGWFEYQPPKGEPGVPYVYFDSRTYNNLTFRVFAQYPPTHHTDPNFPNNGWMTQIDANFGVAQPYFDLNDFYQPGGYQMICAGLDGSFGFFDPDGNPNSGDERPYNLKDGVTSEFKVIPTQQNIRIEDRDNVTSFGNGRLDSLFED